MALLAPYRVNAFNTARDHENKIHDDAVARQYGFRGGLVPGVDVYAYMTHQPVARWGRSWLERGSATCRFLKPVYDGEDAVVTATESDAGLALAVESHGELCATGEAALAPAKEPPPLEAFAETYPPAARLPADERTLAVGNILGIAPFAVTPDFAAAYLADLRETETLYGREGLAHPGLVPKLANEVLKQFVILGPWIHVGSSMQHFSAVTIGDVVTMRARVTGNYERKGHRFVELDGIAVVNQQRVVARFSHTAIYRLRGVA